MPSDLSAIIQVGGGAQLAVLLASALVPRTLEWRKELQPLPRIVRQLFWVYGGYVVLAIVGQGLLCLCLSRELASGTPLARAVCGYMALFWTIRLALATVLDARPYLTSWPFRVGYHLLTVAFTIFVAVFAWATFHPL